MLHRREALSRLAAIALAAVGSGVPGQARAQSYPSRPVRVVVGFPPGTAPDLFLRLIAERLSARLGQPVLVENRPGAAGTIAASHVAAAPPDGSTLMLALAASMSVGPHVMPAVGYDPRTDFAAIVFLQRAPYFIAVHPDLPVRTFGELVDYARARPGVLNYATVGVASAHHVVFEKLRKLAGIEIVHVPTTGTAQSLTETLAGRTQVMIDTMTPAFAAHVKAGRLRLIGSTAATELPQFPEAPPVSVAGTQSVEAYGWWGLVAPAGTPPGIIARLNREVTALLSAPDLVEWLAARGALVADDVGTRPEDLQRFIAAEYARWGRRVADSGVTTN